MKIMKINADHSIQLIQQNVSETAWTQKGLCSRCWVLIRSMTWVICNTAVIDLGASLERMRSASLIEFYRPHMSPSLSFKVVQWTYLIFRFSALSKGKELTCCNLTFCKKNIYTNPKRGFLKNSFHTCLQLCLMEWQHCLYCSVLDGFLSFPGALFFVGLASGTYWPTFDSASFSCLRVFVLSCPFASQVSWWFQIRCLLIHTATVPSFHFFFYMV